MIKPHETAARLRKSIEAGARLTGDDIVHLIGLALDTCGGRTCDGCPLDCKPNDRDCAAFIACKVLQADWSGWRMSGDGMIPARIWREEHKADAKQQD